eukprot:11075946-Ditylum_brightwellii.AAC.1
MHCGTCLWECYKIAIQLGVKGDDGAEVVMNKVGGGEYSERNKGGMAEAILHRVLTVAKSCTCQTTPLLSICIHQNSL